MGYMHTNSKGLNYFLHNKGKLWYFSKSEEGSVDLPDGYDIVENSRTGLPLLKKKK